MSDDDSEPYHWHYAEFDDNDFEIRGRTLFFIIVLFSISVFIILLFALAKWLCRSRSSSPPPQPAASTHVEHAPPPPNPQPQTHQGLDPSTIDSFPIFLHRESSRNRGPLECCICLGIFEAGEKVKVLPDCHHCYHSDCVDKWLKTRSSCPLCRASLRVDSAV